eukprot:scaffold289908_cov31-Tisochrysis_lutea.AAC.1
MAALAKLELTHSSRTLLRRITSGREYIDNDKDMAGPHRAAQFGLGPPPSPRSLGVQGTTRAHEVGLRTRAMGTMKEMPTLGKMARWSWKERRA